MKSLSSVDTIAISDSCPATIRFNDIFEELCNYFHQLGKLHILVRYINQNLDPVWPTTNQSAFNRSYLNYEKMILPQITFSFKNIISVKIHGLFGGRSTATNLYLYVNHVLWDDHFSVCQLILLNSYLHFYGSLDLLARWYVIT